MTVQRLHNLSVDELGDVLVDRLWLRKHVVDTRLGEDGSDIFVAAWKKGEAEFRNRLNEAIGHVLETSAATYARSLPPDPILPLVSRLRTPQAVGPLSVLVAKLQHDDCGSGGRPAERHTWLLLALASAEPHARDSLPLWQQQLSRILENKGSPRCARAVMSRFAHVAPEEALRHLPAVVEMVASEPRPDALALLLRPVLTSGRSKGRMWQLGKACAELNERHRAALRDAVESVTHRANLAEAFAAGAGLGPAGITAIELRHVLPELVPPSYALAVRSRVQSSDWSCLVPKQ